MKTKFQIYLSVLAISVLVVIPVIAYAGSPSSPFVGHWQAIDIDGSDIRLTIGGSADGPFQITWTESYISFCDGESGIVRGTGWLNEDDSNLLEADLHLECFTTGASLDFHGTFTYHPATNTLSSRDNSGRVTIFHRPGPLQAPPPALNLRVNYGGDDWVESFYEAGHTVWITVTEGDGATVRATAKLVTQPRDEWGGEEGFQTSPEDWEPSPPDIQPNDWVYGWVDNGASAQVQIGDISGMVDLEADSIEGTIYAPWFSDEVEVDVECHSWGAPLPEEILKYDMALPNGEDTYSCSWAGEWNILPGQVVGVGYFGPDGHWVANTFSAFTPQIIASESWDWFWTTGFIPGPLNLYIYESADEGADLLWQGTREADEGGFVFVGYDDHGKDLEPGNVLVVSDEMNQKELVLAPISVEVFDVDNDVMSGSAPPGSEVWAAAGPMERQERLFVLADSVSGAWLADFTTIGFDITEEMRPWSYAHIYDGDGDANEGSTPPPPPNPRFTVFPEGEWFDGYDWPDGAMVSITVENKLECQTTGESWGGFFNGSFPEGCDIAIDDVITFTDGETIQTHTIQNLAITDVDKEANTVAGTADVGALVYAWVHEYGYDMELQVEDGTWLADFGSSGLDLVENMGGRVEIRDEFGNGTAVDWWIPNPHFTIFPLWQWYDALDWPDGAIVNITVEGKPECTFAKESWNSFFNGGFPQDCIVEIGDTVMFTDGTTTRSHVVQNLAVTAIDLDEDTISGLADAGAAVFVWPHDAWFEPLQAIANGLGEWQVDLGDVGYDILEGASGRSEVRDEMGNATAVDWSLNARIIVHTTDDWFRAEGFMPNTSLNFRIYDTFGGNPLLESTTAQTDSGGTVTHWVGDQMDIVPGNYVVVSDGTSTRDMVLEALTFDVFDTTLGMLQGTAPEPFGRTVSVGIGCWQREDLTMDVITNEDGDWIVDFGVAIPDDYGCVFAWAYEVDGDISEARPSTRTLTGGNIYVAWSQTNPEEVLYLSWRGSGNLTSTWTHPACSGDLEFFGNSWVSENEGGDPFFFASLVGWGTNGTWAGLSDYVININSLSSDCPGSANFPINTQYQFFEDKPDLIMIQRTFDFGDTPYAHDVRPFIPRLYPSDGFTQVLHPNANGDELVIDTTCDFGCMAESWNGTWFTIHNPETGMGMIVQRGSSSYFSALWLDDDAGSFTNSSSILLLQPDGGFTQEVTDIEYLCFYDSSIWTPSLTIPLECQP